jgi:methionyl-tRNA synthetase
MKPTFYITTPIYYPSGKLHIGNAYTTIFCDALTRYKALNGFNAYYLTGMDEHGKKVETAALKNQKSPQDYVDEIAKDTQQLWSLLDIQYDDFIRTTEKRHKTVVQTFFEKLLEQKDIYLGEYEGHYCIHCESFFTESQLLENNACPDCGRETQKLKEESYFLKLSKYEKKLADYIRANPDFIQPETRRNEVLAFIEQGLNDLSVSRTTFDWGIKVVSNPKHVVYVWLDALTNYISALGYGSEDEKYQKYWLGDEVLHVVGKDILRFHAIYWPIMLMALDIPITFKLYAHGWYLMKDGKMSKSKGGAIYPETFVKRYGLDAFRYYMLKELPFGGDGLFAPDAFLERLNFDLANDLGNLVNRTTAMTEQYFMGEVHQKNAPSDYDIDLEKTIIESITQYHEAMDAYHPALALTAIWKLISRLNKYIDETTPWVLAKAEDKAPLENVMYHLLEGLRVTGILLQPIMPSTSESMFKILNIESSSKSFEALTFGQKASYQGIQRSMPLFPRLDIDVELEALNASLKAPTQTTPSPIAPEILIDDFVKLDLRVGLIKACKKHPDADKLLVSEVDCGEEKTRQIVSGIAQHYTPEQMVGKKVIVVTNLKPVKLRGELSEGMLLAGSNENHLEVVSVDHLNPGDKVK